MRSSSENKRAALEAASEKINAWAREEIAPARRRERARLLINSEFGVGDDAFIENMRCQNQAEFERQFPFGRGIQEKELI